MQLLCFSGCGCRYDPQCQQYRIEIACPIAAKLFRAADLNPGLLQSGNFSQCVCYGRDRDRLLPPIHKQLPAPDRVGKGQTLGCVKYLLLVLLQQCPDSINRIGPGALPP